jgi:hypothetical protein
MTGGRQHTLVMRVQQLLVVALLAGALHQAAAAEHGVAPPRGPLAAIEKLVSWIPTIKMYRSPLPAEQLPALRLQQPWPYRQLSGATSWSLVQTYTHALQATIQHAPLPGVTTDMLVWWFSGGVEGAAAYPGDGITVVDKYLMWHPLDHVMQLTARPAPKPGSLDGALWRIAEFMGSAPPGYTRSAPPPPQQLVKPSDTLYIDVVTQVDQLDRTGLYMSVPSWLGNGKSCWRLVHSWRDTPEGAVVTSVQTIGVPGASWRPLWFARLRNAVVRGLFGRGHPALTAADAWLHHCVEEFGNLPHILPALYAASESPPPPEASGHPSSSSSSLHGAGTGEGGRGALAGHEVSAAGVDAAAVSTGQVEL